MFLVGVLQVVCVTPVILYCSSPSIQIDVLVLVVSAVGGWIVSFLSWADWVRWLAVVPGLGSGVVAGVVRCFSVLMFVGAGWCTWMEAGGSLAGQLVGISVAVDIGVVVCDLRCG